MRPPPRIRIRCQQKQVHGIEKKDYSELVERLVIVK
jgi:hypothetical protein